MLEIRWHGRGGQGAITVSRVLAMAALKKGLFVQSFPEFGPERSGAPVKAYNRLDTRQIDLHCGVYAPDMVAVLDQTLLARRCDRRPKGGRRTRSEHSATASRDS